ncbi:flagellar hook-length control protein FliK [Bosea sp. 124]|uniref:flagellar hook-length control protein FliK n=1 Tax=Bosea sp. 124 TaxID=2135642 RepID=UPI000D474080|nr:flagellar hook-length control protein FliK [Bosea sp. 124]PTM42169.1 flagellar hook-length control protein FliK [Bosea sp. 124]
MNLATLVQSQSLATLLQALAPTTELAPGKTVVARLLALTADGTATAQVGGDTIALVLEGPAARQSALQPGASLVLRLDAADEPGTGLRATLVEVRPPGAQASQPGTPTQPAPATAATPTPAQVAAAASSAPLRGEAAVAVARSGTAPLPSPVLPATQPAALRAEMPTARASTSGSTASPLPGAVAAPQASAQTATPRALAGPLIGPALARQDSLAPLLANMRALADGSVSLALPRPLLTLIDRVLAQAIPVERNPVTAQVLKTAIQGSGLFLEARQADGRPLPPAGDLKAGLQALRDSLAPLVQALSPPAAKPAPPGPSIAAPDLSQPPDHAAKPGPPRRDGALVPQPMVEPSLSAGEKPLAIAETLLAQTDAALDRIKLAQFASLPPEGPRAEAQHGQRWLTELPLAFQNGTTILPLQIEKEPPRRDADGVAGPLWRVRFALDVEPMGPLQGVVTLQGRSVGITLWAEREEASRLLRGASPGLEAALAHAQFENGTIDIHTGHPRVAQPTAGQFLDRMS